jgi:pimeloyl-ACP methyl ester carboxylesterase
MLRSIYQQIGGEKDGQVFPSSPTHIGDTIPGAELVITPNAGHVAHLEVPELFYPPLLKFLR